MKNRMKTVSIELPDYMILALQSESKRLGLSVSKIIEGFAEDFLYKPNADTLAAIEEAGSGVDMEDFDPRSLDKYIERH